MGMSSTQLAEVRSFIGADIPPTDEDLDVLFDNSNSVNDVVLSVLRGRRAEMASGATSVSIPGIYSESHGASLSSLDKQIADIEQGGHSVTTTSRITRPDRSRTGTGEVVVTRPAR